MDYLKDIKREDIENALKNRRIRERIAKVGGVFFGIANGLPLEMSLLDTVDRLRKPISKKLQEMIESEQMNVLFMTVTSGVLGYAFLSTLFDMPHIYRKKGGLGHSLKALWMAKNLFSKQFGQHPADGAQIKSHYDKEIELNIDAIEKVRLSAARDLMEGHADTALKRYRAILDVFRDKSYYSSPVSRLIVELTNQYFKLTRFQKPIRFRLEQIFASLSRGLVKSASKSFAQICDQEDVLKVPVNCLYGYFLESIARTPEEKARGKDQWVKTIDLILGEEALRSSFHRLGTSFHEVLEITGKTILSDTFIFKRSQERQLLEREYGLEKFLYALFQQDSVVEPLSFLIHQNQAYLVLRRIPGKPLATNEDFSVWNRAIEFTSEFHDRLDKPDAVNAFPYKEKIDYPRALRAYAKRVVRDDQGRERIIAATLFLADYLSQKRQQIIHGDFHPENIFVTENGFTVLDPERMIYGDPKSDLVDLIESRLVPDKFGESDREKWRRSYYEGKKREESYDQWNLDYAYAAVARLLKTVGTLTAQSYGFTPEESQKIKEDYLVKARAQLHVLAQLDETRKEEARRLEEIILAS